MFCIPIIGISQDCRINYNKIDIENGLNTSYINDVTTDEFGFLWIATEDGVNRYDGKNSIGIRKGIDSVSLNFENVQSICALENQKLLVGGLNGQLQFLDLSIAKSKSIELNALLNKPINDIVKSRDKIYLNLGNELLVLNNESFSINEQLSNKNTGEIYFLKKDNLGIVWMSTSNGLFILRDGGKLNKIPNTQNLGLIDISSDQNGYWAISQNSIYKISSQLRIQKMQIDGFNAGMYGFTVIGVYNDYLLLGSDENGFWMLNKSNNSVNSCYNNGEVYPYTSINKSFQDISGNLFLATAGDGVIHLNLSSVFSPINALGLKNRTVYNANVHCFQQNRLYLFQANQINVFDAELNQINSIKLRFSNKQMVNAMAKVGSKFYLATNGGVAVFDSTGRQIDNLIHNEKNELSIQSNLVNQISFNGSILFVGTSKGLSQIDPKTGIAKRFENIPVKTLALWSSKNKTFAATEYAVYKVASDYATNLKIDGVQQSAFSTITSLYAQNNILWIGT
ncbi:MAG: ligand-binding sensor domain-containing protein, partial [Bacteroidia bacterium]